SLRYFLILNINHLLPVQPGGNMASDSADPDLVPFIHFQYVLVFIRNTHQPSPSLVFIDSTGIMIVWSYFNLPSANFGSIKSGTEKYTTVAISFLQEFKFHLKIVVVLLC